jgi:hypothetical protein
MSNVTKNSKTGAVVYTLGRAPVRPVQGTGLTAAGQPVPPPSKTGAIVNPLQRRPIGRK